MDALLDEARAFAEGGAWREALAALERAVREAPGHPAVAALALELRDRARGLAGRAGPGVPVPR